MQVIENSYTNSDFDVNAFADAMGISKTLLNQKLQNLVGNSTSKFIGNYRLKKAQELIIINKVSKNMNVSEIAYSVGFNDQSHTTHINNTIIQRYDLSLQDLQDANWMLTYPPSPNMRTIKMWPPYGSK